MVLEHPFAMVPDESRYEFQQKLGAGASGCVYLVRDRETGEQLALKQLHRADDRSIARLKREFRTLTNINHRNVVRLYDLGRAQNAWFLTMEYIAGTDLTRYVRLRAGPSTTFELGRADSVDLGETERILSAFLELAEGVRALHRAHVLHRDLKPSNVLVGAGRVVVVDFGLALEVGAEATTVTVDGRIAGTPAYMAPEQLQGRHWGEPNDWYSFGVMLYEALSGELPIDGKLHEILRRKLDCEPVPIERRVQGLPAELCRLCAGLLQREPELRPSGDEVLSVLQACTMRPATADMSRGTVEVTTERSALRERYGDPAFIGRELECAQLRDALGVADAGAFAAVHVCGVSGAGKSALVERFLDELDTDKRTTASPPLILRGRCYEREAIPFKALDAVMDALATQLRREDDFEVSFVLPHAIATLTQVFPSLNELSVVQRLNASNPRPIAAAPHAREEAESALRELFMRLGNRRLVVLWIDDLHWGDLDSARIIKSWMQPPGIAGMLLLLSYRSDETSTSPCLRSLLDERTSCGLERTIALGPLSDEHIRGFCRQQLARYPPAVVDAIVDHIVSEAGGSPFLASQLTTLALTELAAEAPEPFGELTVEALVSRRTGLLSPPARRLLNVLSVASRPLRATLALRLAEASDSGRAALHELASSGLIRTRHSADERLLSVYHDRLREGVLASLNGDECAALDRELLRALETEGAADAAWLHSLALGAGDKSAALRYGLSAAERATAALAFEHAAELYRQCLALCPDPSVSLAELWQKRALALAHCGHGRQAAAAYLQAAQRSQGDLALQLERSAASHLLRSGHFEEGEALVHKVLQALRLETPRSTIGLLLAIAWERLRLSLRGLRYKPRRLEDTPFWVRYGGLLCGTLSVEIQPYDPLRAALFQVRSLRIALAAGVPELIARALCVAATMASVPGGRRGAARAAALLERASQLEQTFPSTLVRGNISSARAVCAMLQGDMPGVLVHSQAADRMFREVNASDEGEYYHRFTVLAARVSALFHVGRHLEAREVIDHAVNEACATENVGAILLLSGLRTRLDIADGRPDKAAARLETERGQLPPQRFGLLHVYNLVSVLRVGCAARDHDWALGLIGDDWTRFRRSIFRRSGYMAVLVVAAHARLLLNRCVARKQRAREAADVVAGHLRMLKRTGGLAATAALARTRARLAWMAGAKDEARRQLELSRRGFEGLDNREEAARDRYAYGVSLGDEAGAQQRDAALELLRELGYRNPEDDLRGYYPELFALERC